MTRSKHRIPAPLYRQARRLFLARPHLADRIRRALPLAICPSGIEPAYRATIDNCRCADTFFRRPYWLSYQRVPCKHRIALWLRAAAGLGPDYAGTGKTTPRHSPGR